MLDEVNVTAQAIPGAVIGDIPPENSLTQRDIRAYGVGTVAELLDEIAAQTTSGQSRDGGGPVVLVNGRRISGVNEVGDLPTEAVLRLDILPEEVALKYGYSSDQKVVNVILRRRFSAETGEASAGGSTDGGGQRVRGNGALTRIRENQRLNVAVTAQLQDSITEAQRGITPATDEPQSGPANRTLQPERRSYSANAVYASPLSSTISSSTNLTATHTTSQSQNGLTSTEPVQQLDREGSGTTLHLGTSLNMDVPNSWRVSLIGAYDHSNSDTDTERASGTAAGGVSLDRARSTSDAADASVLATRKLFALPAGNLLLSFQAGGQAGKTRSETTDTRSQPAQSLSRSSGNARASVDIPITRRGGWGGAMGSLTINANAAASRISQFHMLTTSGYGLNWSPLANLSFIAAVSQDRRAPTAEQLVNPTVTNIGASIYDYATGASVLVTSTSGGNPLLVADDRRTFKLGTTFKPFADRNFTLTANYSQSRTKNAIQSLPGISASLEAAFPQRFLRDEDGDLVAIDTRAVNVASQERSNLRWGFNLTHVLREPQRPQRPAFGERQRQFRTQPMAGRTGGAPPAQADAATQDGNLPAAPDALSVAGDQDQTLDEAVVTGRRESDEGMPQRGFGGRGRGPGAGRFAGGFPGGEGRGGFGGGPGGPGGFGGGGRGGPGGFGGGNNGAQLQLSVYHTWLFRNEVTLREGLEPIDLLGGGTLGGSPPVRHLVQANGGVTDNGIGIRFTGEWRSAGSALHSAAGVDSLHFGSLGTLDLRLFADLAQRLPQKTWARGLRVTLAVQNIFNDWQKVTNEAGLIPQAYQPGYLDATGRALLLTLRKIQ